MIPLLESNESHKYTPFSSFQCQNLYFTFSFFLIGLLWTDILDSIAMTVFGWLVRDDIIKLKQMIYFFFFFLGFMLLNLSFPVLEKDYFQR